MELLEYYAAFFCRVAGLMNQVATYLECDRSLNRLQVDALRPDLEQLGRECVRLKLNASVHKVMEIVSYANSGQNINDPRFGNHLKELHSRIVAELSGPLFFCVEAAAAEYRG